MKNLRLKNISKTIIGQINIYSISSKFDQLKELVLKHVVLVVCETKLDEIFLSSQFHMDGFSLPYRLDGNRNGEDVMIFVMEDIPSNLLTKHNFQSDVEGLFAELNFRKSKWLLFCICHPPAQNDQYFFNCIDKALDTYSNYDNVLLAGDVNAEDNEPYLSDFLYQDDLYDLVLKVHRNQHPLISFHQPKKTHFQNTVAVCSGLSDFHKLVIMVLKTSFNKNKPCEILYRDYKTSTLNLLMKIYKIF